MSRNTAGDHAAATSQATWSPVMTLGEVARLTRVSRPAVSNWRRRYPDFPGPSTVGRSAQPMFAAAAVHAWLEAHPELGNVDAAELREEAAIHALSGFANRVPGSQLLEVMTAMLCLRALEDDEPLAEPGAPDVAAAVLARASDEDFEDLFLLRELSAVPQATVAQLAAAADEISEACYGAADAFEVFLDARERVGLAGPGSDALAVPLLDLAGGIFHRLAGYAAGDRRRLCISAPDCGSGELLATLIRTFAPELRRDLHILASDPDERAVRLVHRRMLCLGIQEHHMDIAVGTEPHRAMAEYWRPQFTISAIPYIGAEQREVEVPLARVAEIVAMPHDTAWSALVIGPAAAFTDALPADPDTARTRRATLFSRGLMESAVALPPGTRKHRHGHRDALFVLRDNAAQASAGYALLGDASRLALTRQLVDELADDLVIWHRDRSIEHHYPHHAWPFPLAAIVRDPGAALRMPRRNTTYARNEGAARRVDALRTVEAALSQHAAEAAIEHRPLPGLVQRRTNNAPTRVSLGELRARHHIAVHPGVRLRAPVRENSHLERTTEHGYRLIGPEELANPALLGRRYVDQIDFVAAHPNANPTESGDVVVWLGDEIRALVDGEGTSVAQYPAQIVRIRTDVSRAIPQPTPRVLAALLTADQPGGGSRVRGIANLSIPQLDRDEITAYDRFLADLETRRTRLLEHLGLLDRIGHMTGNGLADGSFTVTAPPAPSPIVQI